MSDLIATGNDAFAAKNKSQVFFAHTLSLAYAEVRSSLVFIKKLDIETV